MSPVTISMEYSIILSWDQIWLTKLYCVLYQFQKYNIKIGAAQLVVAISGWKYFTAAAAGMSF